MPIHFLWGDEDFLIEKDGKLIISPSASPENYFMFDEKKCGIAEWTAIDQGICIDFFDKLIKACDELNKDSSSYRSTLEKLQTISIAPDGRIAEWNEDFEEEDKGHRHISHLYGIYPADILTGSEYISAIKKSLDTRVMNGDAVHTQYNGKAFHCGHIGWSCAWIACVYARLGDGENFMKEVRKFLKNCVYDNLLSICTIFQIEGNFGIASAMIEALVQSHGEKVVTTPAIPKEWEHGEVNGIVVRTGEKISFKW